MVSPSCNGNKSCFFNDQTTIFLWPGWLKMIGFLVSPTCVFFYLHTAYLYTVELHIMALVTISGGCDHHDVDEEASN